ncbi:MAG: hypothetical protein BKP49_04525 [Treponema sp. CETP13]|nr:MAG: hypothetical protein BKP49_04525 [Treponema sp. CETP13]
MYKGGLTDALQLTISMNCFTLLLIITITYFTYFFQTKEKTFLAGGLVTGNIMLFILAEVLIIIAGWKNSILFGRYLYRAEQIPIFLFLASLLFFIQNLLHLEGLVKKLFKYLIYIGISITIITGILSIISPESFISVIYPSMTPQVSPGDFARGLEGPLYRVRDIMLCIYIVISLGYAIFHVIKKSTDFQSVTLLVGLIISVLGGFDDMQYVYSGKNYLLNNIRFSRFALGTTIMLLFFFASVFKKYFTAHTMLKKTTQELENFENKYSLLLDSTKELIFSLSKDMTILSANAKAKQILKLTGKIKNFSECIYHNEFESTIDTSVLKEQFAALQKSGEVLTTNFYILDPITKEPVEYQFRFDSFSADGNIEIFGRGWPLKQSKLNKYVKAERISLDVENHIVMVDDIVTRITSNISKCLDDGDIMMIKMALQEMVVNAMEHGNLNISFDEKTKAQEEGRLFDFMKERRENPKYRNRKVSIDYYFDEHKIAYRITDMGNGFNYKEMMSRINKEVNKQSMSHGRGILMTKAVFDKVKYNDKGNQVLLIKHLA